MTAQMFSSDGVINCLALKKHYRGTSMTVYPFKIWIRVSSIHLKQDLGMHWNTKLQLIKTRRNDGASRTHLSCLQQLWQKHFMTSAGVMTMSSLHQWHAGGKVPVLQRIMMTISGAIWCSLFQEHLTQIKHCGNSLTKKLLIQKFLLTHSWPQPY